MLANHTYESLDPQQGWMWSRDFYFLWRNTKITLCAISYVCWSWLVSDWEVLCWKAQAPAGMVTRTLSGALLGEADSEVEVWGETCPLCCFWKGKWGCVGTWVLPVSMLEEWLNCACSLTFYESSSLKETKCNCEPDSCGPQSGVQALLDLNCAQVFCL